MAFGFDDALAVGGGLASLLGGGGGKAQRQADAYRNQSENFLKRQNGVLGDIRGLRDSSMNAYTDFAPDALSSLRGYADYLGQDPWTDERNSAYLNNATEGIDADYARGVTNSVAQNALAGTPQSSRTAGDIYSLTNNRNAVFGKARNDRANFQAGDRERRLAQLASVLGGARSGFLNETQGGNQDLYSGYGAQSSAYGNLAGGAQGRADAAGGAQAGLYGGLASYLPGLLNGNKAEATKPVPSLYGVTPFNPAGSNPGWQDDLMQRQRQMSLSRMPNFGTNPVKPIGSY